MTETPAKPVDQQPSPYVQLPKGALSAVFAVAAIWAYFMQPVLRLSDPQQLSTGSLFFGIGLLLTIGGNLQRRWFEGLLGLGALLYGGSILALATDNAVAVANANDARCARIEVAMLEPTPVREDLPDLFTALGCRPQYANLAQMPSKAK